MHSKLSEVMLLLTMFLTLLCPIRAARADICADGCGEGDPNVAFGDGSSGSFDVPAGQQWTLPAGRNYRDFTVPANSVVDLNGRVLRVCGTLTNHGRITDTEYGGSGGSGGARGKGSDPYSSGECSGQGRFCTPGGDGSDGGNDPSPGGDGGDGGGGGGGGGGAVCAAGDAHGGDGARGGRGGDGGGYVRIYAWCLDNQGIIEADGHPGNSGGNAPSTGNCAAEYFPYEGPFVEYDIAGGGGGGGGGGDGGDGGTVEVHFAILIHRGEIHANGGGGGSAGLGGFGGTQIEGHDLIDGCHTICLEGDGCAGGGGGSVGGHGGAAACHDGDSSENGGNGASGRDGTDGEVLLIREGTVFLAQSDVLHYDLEMKIDIDDETISQASNTIEVQATEEIASFYIRLDRESFSDPQIGVGEVPNPPLQTVDWFWLNDDITIAIELDRPYMPGEIFYVDVDYNGDPRIEIGPFERPRGMQFGDHDGTPIMFTSVEPWYPYLWIPLKDDATIWNCDKANADLAFTVPSEYRAVSQGRLISETIPEPGWIRYHWKTNHLTADYLFSVAATNYGEPEQVQSPITDIQLYFYPEDDDPDDRQHWGRVGQMMDLFSREDRYGPYPFADEKYAIYQWPDDPSAGGMEHLTAVGQAGLWDDDYYSTPWRNVEVQTAHELAHQWWGDSLSCAEWHHIWLSEGLAAYSEAVWFETQYDRDINDVIWWPLIRGDPLKVLENYVRWGYWPAQHGLNATVYVEDITDDSNILDYLIQYKKSPWVLHMLRHIVDPDYGIPPGETIPATPVFFGILNAYWSEPHAPPEDEGCARTEDFVRAAEQVCEAEGIYDMLGTYEDYPGTPERNLEWFFGTLDESDGWIYGTGAPAYRYRTRIYNGDDGHSCVYLSLRQVQQRWHETDPIFTMPVDIDLIHCGGEVERIPVWNYQDYQTYVLDSDQSVCHVKIDPDLWILKRSIGWDFRYFMPAISPVLEVDVGPAGAVNNRDVVAGGGDFGAGDRALVWFPSERLGLDAGRNDLGALGGPWSRAYDINDRGEIVGDVELPGGGTRAFLWLPEPAYGLSAGMNTLPSSGDAHARAINLNGQVAGWAGNQPILWQSDGSNWFETSLPTIDQVSAHAWDVNDAGQLCGIVDPQGAPIAVFWEYDLGTGEWTVAELGEGAAYALNTAGQVGGSNAVGQQCLWEQQEDDGWGEYSLPCGPTPQCVGAVYGINDYGDAVGESAGSAMLWSGGVGTNLNDSIEDLDHSIHLRAALDINTAGRIVTWGIHSGSSYHLLLIDRESDPDCDGNGVLDADQVIEEPTEYDPDGDGMMDHCALADAPGFPATSEPGREGPGFRRLTHALGGRPAEIVLWLDRARDVNVSLHDVAGRQVAMLGDGRFDPGEHILIWSGLDQNGHRVASGVYFVRMRSEGVRVSERVLVLK